MGDAESVPLTYWFMRLGLRRGETGLGLVIEDRARSWRWGSSDPMTAARSHFGKAPAPTWRRWAVALVPASSREDDRARIQTSRSDSARLVSRTCRKYGKGSSEGLRTVGASDTLVRMLCVVMKRPSAQAAPSAAVRSWCPQVAWTCPKVQRWHRFDKAPVNRYPSLESAH